MVDYCFWIGGKVVLTLRMSDMQKIGFHSTPVLKHSYALSVNIIKCVERN